MLPDGLTRSNTHTHTLESLTFETRATTWMKKTKLNEQDQVDA